MTFMRRDEILLVKLCEEALAWHSWFGLVVSLKDRIVPLAHVAGLLGMVREQQQYIQQYNESDGYW